MLGCCCNSTCPGCETPWMLFHRQYVRLIKHHSTFASFASPGQDMAEYPGSFQNRPSGKFPTKRYDHTVVLAQHRIWVFGGSGSYLSRSLSTLCLTVFCVAAVRCCLTWSKVITSVTCTTSIFRYGNHGRALETEQTHWNAIIQNEFTSSSQSYPFSLPCCSSRIRTHCSSKRRFLCLSHGGNIWYFP